MSTQDELTVGYICADVKTLASCIISLDEECSPRSTKPHDNNIYNFGKIGPHNIAICCMSLEGGIDSATAAVDMMNSFPSIKLLILVSGNSGAVPRDDGQVRVGDVVVAQEFITTNPDGDLIKKDLRQGSGLLATADSQRWSLDADIAKLVLRNKPWGGKCGRPAGDDTDKLDRIFVPRQDELSVVHRRGLVISNSTYPEHAELRDLVASPWTIESASVVCFDHGQTAGLPLNKDVDKVSVLGVSNYCDEDTDRARKVWTPYASMAAAACARKIVMQLATETTQGGMAKGEGKEDN